MIYSKKVSKVPFWTTNTIKLHRRELYHPTMAYTVHSFHKCSSGPCYMLAIALGLEGISWGMKEKGDTRHRFILHGRSTWCVWSWGVKVMPDLWAVAACFGWFRNSWSRVWTWTRWWRCSPRDMGQCILAQGGACHLSASGIPLFLPTGYHQRRRRQLKTEKESMDSFFIILITSVKFRFSDKTEFSNVWKFAFCCDCTQCSMQLTLLLPGN